MRIKDIYNEPDEFENNSSADYMNGEHGKYCSCLLKVASDQTPECILNKEYEHNNRETKCYNPYAICAKSTKSSTHSCAIGVNYAKLPMPLLRAQAGLYGLSLDGSREDILNRIYEYKRFEGKF